MVRILTFCAAHRMEISRHALELLAAAQALKVPLGGGTVHTLCIGSSAGAFGEELIHRGADQVLMVEYPSVEPEVALAAMEFTVRYLSPQVVLLPHDDLGGAYVGPCMAHRLKAGIVTDCTGFVVRGENICWLRPVYGGKAMAYMRVRGPLQLATMRSRAFDPLPAEPARSGEIRRLPMDWESVRSQIHLIERLEEKKAEGELPLDRAEIIVSGGRGIGGGEGFTVLRELARVLEAAVGGSRPAADLGWIPHSHLIGQTGKIVAPNLYIAIGISGAAQHMAGAGSSKTIVAINKDPDAPIFKLAHIGVVGEWEKVIPPLIEALKLTGVASPSISNLSMKG